MKKIFFAVVMMAVALSASAQPREKADFKAGKNSLEIGFNPFATNWENFRIDDLKYRRFFGRHALRVGLGIDVISEKRGEITTYDRDEDSKVGSVENYEKNSATELSFKAGYEYHFNVAPRVSLYVGGEFVYTGAFGKTTNYTSEEYKEYSDNKIIGSKDALYDMSTKASGKYNAFSVNALAGIDFHIYRGLYLGTEITLGYQYKKFSDPLVEDTDVEHFYDAAGKLTGGHEIAKTIDGSRQITTGYLIDPDGGRTEINDITDVEGVNNDQSFKLAVAGSLRIGYRF